ncbi:MAG: lysyl oxidase family protein [Gaiellaceae bacterium]
MRKVVLLALGAFLAFAAYAAAEPRDSVSRQFPLYENGGKADLTVDPKRFVSQMEIVDRWFDAGSCELVEGSVNGSGYRRILRFDTVIINAGGADLALGSPTDPDNPYVQAGVFEFSPCHGHYHMSGFADYQLLTTDGAVAAPGHKQAFCFISTLKYSNDLNGQDKPSYSCADQGIARGYGDWYYKQLSGQWIDITGVPEGDYVVRVAINAAGSFDEGENRYTNVVTTTIHVPDPRKKVASSTESLSYEP